MRGLIDFVVRRSARRWLVLLMAVLLAVPAGVAESSPSRFSEVARVPLLGVPEVSDVAVDRSGWLILDPTTRRGYQVFETTLGGQARTVVQSFDLDTLAPRRRAVLSGAPVTSGVADVATVSSTTSAGEVVHAIDHATGRIYLAMSQPQAFDQQPGQLVGGFGLPADGQRPLDRFVAIDQAAFDRGDAAFATSFRVPVEQARLQHYWLVGTAVPRPGKLLALFAQPQPGGSLNSAPFFDHTLVQWDVGGAGATADWERRLDVCSAAPLASRGGVGQGAYQWGILATSDAVYTACQAAEGSGAVVRVALDDDGTPALVGGQELHRLSQRISDVLVDERGERLLVRSFGGGTTLWVFDAAVRRFTGAFAVKQTDAYSVALGLNTVTGRLYALLPDHTVFGVGGQQIPVQGGLQYSDTRPDPPSPLSNVVPELAYPALFRIQVDPVTRRFFVRRGHPAQQQTVVYPGTQLTAPAPVEPFYRVFEDRVKPPR